jgi:hypothetical protein
MPRSDTVLNLYVACQQQPGPYTQGELSLKPAAATTLGDAKGLTKGNFGGYGSVGAKDATDYDIAVDIFQFAYVLSVLIPNEKSQKVDLKKAFYKDWLRDPAENLWTPKIYSYSAVRSLMFAYSGGNMCWYFFVMQLKPAQPMFLKMYFLHGLEPSAPPYNTVCATTFPTTQQFVERSQRQWKQWLRERGPDHISIVQFLRDKENAAANGKEYPTNTAADGSTMAAYNPMRPAPSAPQSSQANPRHARITDGTTESIGLGWHRQ